MEDENDNAPYVVPSVVRVCEDAKEVNVAVIGARDKDIHPNADPFRIELGKQPGLEKTWKISRINSKMLLHVCLELPHSQACIMAELNMPQNCKWEATGFELGMISCQDG